MELSAWSEGSRIHKVKCKTYKYAQFKLNLINVEVCTEIESDMRMTQ